MSCCKRDKNEFFKEKGEFLNDLFAKYHNTVIVRLILLMFFLLLLPFIFIIAVAVVSYGFVSGKSLDFGEIVDKIKNRHNKELANE